jgi:hypothetical protein
MFLRPSPNSSPRLIVRPEPSKRRNLGSFTPTICLHKKVDFWYRVLTKSLSAEVEITIRAGHASATRPVPLEPFAVNKDMGRILIRRGGETVGAGVVLELVTIA